MFGALTFGSIGFGAAGPTQAQPESAKSKSIVAAAYFAQKAIAEEQYAEWRRVTARDGSAHVEINHITVTGNSEVKKVEIYCAAQISVGTPTLRVVAHNQPPPCTSQAALNQSGCALTGSATQRYTHKSNARIRVPKIRLAGESNNDFDAVELEFATALMEELWRPDVYTANTDELVEK